MADNGEKRKEKVHFLEAEEDMKATSPALSKAESEPDLQLDQHFNSSAALRHRAGNRNNNSNEIRRPVPLSRSQSFTSPVSFVGPLLTVSPAEELIFQVGDGENSFDMISLTNSLPVPVAFKVKTTAPEKFRVRPIAGIIKPDEKEEVYVYLVPDFSADLAKDKFLVMAMETAATNVADPISLFKDAPRDKIMQHKMRCTTTTAKERRVASPDEKLASKVAERLFKKAPTCAKKEGKEHEFNKVKDEGDYKVANEKKVENKIRSDLLPVNSSLEKQFAALHCDNEMVRYDYHQLKLDHDRLVIENTKLADRNSVLESSFSALNENNRESRALAKHLTIKNIRLKEELKQVSAKNTSLETQLSNLHEDNIIYHSRFDQIQQETNELRAELNQLSKKISSLHRKLQEKKNVEKKDKKDI